MIITRQQIKQVLKELLNARIEMTLVDYSSSNEESITKTRVVNLNLMSLKFMLNESFTLDEKNSILIAEDLMNFTLDMSVTNISWTRRYLASIIDLSLLCICFKQASFFYVCSLWYIARPSNTFNESFFHHIMKLFSTNDSINKIQCSISWSSLRNQHQIMSSSHIISKSRFIRDVEIFRSHLTKISFTFIFFFSSNHHFRLCIFAWTRLAAAGRLTWAGRIVGRVG